MNYIFGLFPLVSSAMLSRRTLLIESTGLCTPLGRHGAVDGQAFQGIYLEPTRQNVLVCDGDPDLDLPLVHHAISAETEWP